MWEIEVKGQKQGRPQSKKQEQKMYQSALEESCPLARAQTMLPGSMEGLTCID